MSTLTQALQRLQQQGISSTAATPEEKHGMESENCIGLGTQEFAAMETSLNVSAATNCAANGPTPPTLPMENSVAIRSQETFELLEAAIRESLGDTAEQLHLPIRPVSFQEMLHKVGQDGVVEAPVAKSEQTWQPGWTVEKIIARAVEIENASCVMAPVSDGEMELETDHLATHDEFESAIQFAAQLAQENSGLMVDLTPTATANDDELNALAIELDVEANPPDWLCQRQGEKPSPNPVARSPQKNLTDEFQDQYSEIPFRITGEKRSQQGKSSDDAAQDPLDDIERLMQEFAAEFSDEEHPSAHDAGNGPVEIPWDSPDPLLESRSPNAHRPPSMGELSVSKENRLRTSSSRSISAIHELPEAMARARREPLLWQAYRGLGDQIDHDLPSRGTGSLMLFAANKEAHVTDTALQLAYYQAEEGMRRVVLVDGNMAQKSLSLRLGIDSQPGFSELAAQLATWDRVTHATPHERLFAVGAGQRTNTGTFDEVAILSVIMELNNNFDLVIIDAGEAAASLFPALYNACDCSYLITRLGRTPRESLQKLVRKLREANLVPTGCIVTNAPMSMKK